MPETIDKVDSYEERKAAYQLALRILAGADQSKGQLGKRLLKRGYESGTVNEVLASLSELGYINNLALAQSLANRYLRKRVGKSAIAQRLKVKGLGAVEIAQALDELDTGDECEAARALGQRLWDRLAIKDLPTYEVRQKVGAKLYSRGYSMEVINPVLQHLVANN